MSDVEDHDDGWQIHKSSRFLIDDDFDSLVRAFVSRTHGHASRTLVLNGDIIDFDLVTVVPSPAPWPVTPFECERGLDATEPKSAWKLAYILRQHPRFVATLAEFAAAGNRIVYVLGNHDREMHFAGVQRVLLEALEAHAASLALRIPEGALRFEPWFYYVPNEIYAEHGNQFDHYSSFKDVLSPVVDGRDGPVIAVPMGNLSNRYMGTRMGFFNPHSAEFVLNFVRYIAHWLEHYAFTRRSLFVNWLVGSFLVLVRLIDQKKKLLLRRRDEDAVAQVARRFNLSVATLDALARLHKPPIANRMYRVVREFWLDRLVMILVMAAGAVAFAFAPLPFWAKLTIPLLGFPLTYFVYERLSKGDNIFTMEQQIPSSARSIADTLPVSVVTFGHTHKPRLIPLRDGATFIDTGAWAPITRPNDRNTLAPGYRNYIVADFTEGPLRLTFDCWPIGGEPAVAAPTVAVANQDQERQAAAGKRVAS